MVEETILFEDEKYIGETKDGLPHGNGIYYDEDGNKTYQGQWKNGQK